MYTDNGDCFKNVPDIDLVKAYRFTQDPTCISELIDRYKYFIYKTIARWNDSNHYCVKITESDLDDANQCAYLGVMMFMTRTKDLDRVKNVSISMRSYIYTALNKYYRHRSYERYGEGNDTSAYVPPHMTEQKVKDINPDRDVLLYFKYFYGYNYYKLALMLTKSKNNNFMRVSVSRLIRKKLNKFRKQKGLL